MKRKLTKSNARILIACEKSGRVRDAFVKEGFKHVYSCDLLPSDSPGRHIISKGDADLTRIVYGKHWDAVISFPPCTRLTNTVTWYVNKHKLHHEVRKAARFFNMLLKAPAKFKAVENPVQSGYARKFIRKFDQVIQPYEFGNNAKKKTCLWVENLPLLKPTRYIEPRIVKGQPRWANQTDSGNDKTPSTKRQAMLRGYTQPGIARAMAKQWGRAICN